MRALIIPALLALAACSGPPSVVLRDPATKQVAECRAYPDTFGQAAYVENCARKYEQAGFQRMK